MPLGYVGGKPAEMIGGRGADPLPWFRRCTDPEGKSKYTLLCNANGTQSENAPQHRRRRAKRTGVRSIELASVSLQLTPPLIPSMILLRWIDRHHLLWLLLAAPLLLFPTPNRAPALLAMLAVPALLILRWIVNSCQRSAAKDHPPSTIHFPLTVGYNNYEI